VHLGYLTYKLEYAILMIVWYFKPGGIMSAKGKKISAVYLAFSAVVLAGMMFVTATTPNFNTLKATIGGSIVFSFFFVDAVSSVRRRYRQAR
jgi:hypothetical protein